jgi:anaerobic selenocysteine-containing dehydrogenase
MRIGAEPRSAPVKGCCPLDCQDSCAWVAHVEAGRVVRVEGAKGHPFTRGVLCAKVNDYERRTYADDRLLYPLRRAGRKGAGAFTRISWDDALDEIAARFTAIIDAHGAEALLPINYLGSMGVLQRRSLMRLFHVLGTSVFHGSICGASGNVLEAEGHRRGFDPEQIVNSRFILLWGANLLSTSHHHWHFVNEARRLHRARLVCIDPARTRTARQCDEHVSIRPGSDAVFAAGLAHVMFEEGLTDQAFMAQVAEDGDAFREQVRPWTPGAVAAVCGVDAAVVVRLAREFATARPSLIRCGVAPQQTEGGESFVRALSALAIAGGHWRLPGGGLFIETGPAMDESRASRPDLRPAASRSLDIAGLGEHLTSTSLSPRVMGLMVWGTNPAVVQADAGRTRAGLARDDLFTVVLEHFMTDTARFADIVLPSTTQLEHFDVQGAWGHQYISVNNPAVPPIGEARPHSAVMRALAARLGLDHPALRETDEQIAAAVLPPGIDLSSLRARGWHKSPPAAPDWMPGRKVRIAGDVPVPPSPPASGMLQLLTPKSHHFMNSSFGNMPRQRKAMIRPTLDMHPADASARALADGARVTLRNGRGHLYAWVRVTDDVRPGVVVLPGKWWSVPEETGAVANLLTPSTWTPGGQPAYNDTFVEVSATPQA